MTGPAIPTSAPPAPVVYDSPGAAPAPEPKAPRITTEQRIQEKLKTLGDAIKSGQAQWDGKGEHQNAEAPAPTPATPAATPEPVPTEGQTTEPQPDTSGRLRNPDGTFAPADGQPKAEPPADEAPEGLAVKLLRPNGEELELEVPDQETADLINTLRNNGMRKQEWVKRQAALDEERAQLQTTVATIQAAPEAWSMALPKDQQLSMARLLIAQHIEELAPHIQQMVGYDDRTGQADAWKAKLVRDNYLLTQKPEIEKKRDEHMAKVDQFRQERQIINTINDAFPDTMTVDEGKMVWDVLAPYFARKVQEGIALNAKTALDLAKPVLQSFTFWKGNDPSQPLNGKATEPAVSTASTTPAKPATSPEDQQKRQDAQRRRVYNSRERSKHIAPTGASVSPSPVPRTDVLKGKSVEEKFKILSQNPDLLRTGAPG